MRSSTRARRGPPGVAASPGLALEPLAVATDPAGPLISKLQAVPARRAKYISYIRETAIGWLDWARLAPIVESYQRVIAQVVAHETPNLGTFHDFVHGVTELTMRARPRGSERGYGIEPFVEARASYLLNHPAIKSAGAQQISREVRAATGSVSRH